MMNKRNKKDNLIHARTCVYNTNYHFVWSTKYRKAILTGEVEKRLEHILNQVAIDKGFTIQTMEIMSDHLHLFVTAHPKVAPSYIVKMCKGISGRLLLKEFSNLREQLYKGHLWNPSYYVETVGSISEEAVKKYIQNQKE
jgi:putative transposase